MPTGYDLLSTLRQQAMEQESGRTRAPVACPNDGTPFKDGPPGHAVVLFCPFCNFQYPRDWDPIAHGGM